MKKISLFLCFFIAIAVNAQDTLKIWLALPFSADVSAKEMKSKKLHAPQKASIDYYTGALVALDSLQKAGKNIRFVVKDTRKDSATTAKMFRNFNSGDADIIIGPVTKKWFLNANPIIAKKGALHVSPVLDYPKMNGLANSVFFETDVSGFGKSLAQYFYHKHGKDGHLILVHDGSPEDKIFSNDFMALKDSLSLDIQEIQLKNAADLPKLFQNSGINLLIFPAVKEAKVNQFFGQLRNAWKDSIQVWGLGGWHEMKNVDFDKWDRFQVALVMQSPYDFFHEDVLRFRNSYFERFKNEPSNLAMDGFLQMYYLGSQDYTMIRSGNFSSAIILGRKIRFVESHQKNFMNQHAAIFQFTNRKLSLISELD